MAEHQVMKMEEGMKMNSKIDSGSSAAGYFSWKQKQILKITCMMTMLDKHVTKENRILLHI